MTDQVQLRFLNDFDVLGIAGLRKKELLKEMETLQSRVVLQCHMDLIPEEQKSFYTSVLEETLQWLKPARTQLHHLEEPRETFLLRVLAAELQRAFPKTLLKIGAAKDRLLQQYLQEFPWQGPLLSDHFRYWPAYLKQQMKSAEIALIAQHEWFISFLSFSNFGWPRKEPGILKLNPSIQTFAVAQPTLDFSEGLSVLFVHPETSEVGESKLDIIQAEILDLLMEERKFSFSQILEQLETAKTSNEDPAKKLSNLIDQGIILNN